MALGCHVTERFVSSPGLRRRSQALCLEKGCAAAEGAAVNVLCTGALLINPFRVCAFVADATVARDFCF